MLPFSGLRPRERYETTIKVHTSLEIAFSGAGLMIDGRQYLGVGVSSRE